MTAATQRGDGWRCSLRVANLPQKGELGAMVRLRAAGEHAHRLGPGRQLVGLAVAQDRGQPGDVRLFDPAVALRALRSPQAAPAELARWQTAGCRASPGTAPMAWRSRSPALAASLSRRLARSCLAHASAVHGEQQPSAVLGAQSLDRLINHRDMVVGRAALQRDSTRSRVSSGERQTRHERRAAGPALTTGSAPRRRFWLSCRMDANGPAICGILADQLALVRVLENRAR